MLSSCTMAFKLISAHYTCKKNGPPKLNFKSTSSCTEIVWQTLPKLSVRSGWGILSRRNTEESSLQSPWLFPPLSAVRLTAIPYALQYSHIRAPHQLLWPMFLVSTFHQPAVLLCGVQDSQQQLRPNKSTWHLQPQLHNLAKQKDLVLSLQSISID